MQQILIVEDDISLSKGLKKALTKDDVQVVSCSTIKSAQEQLSVIQPALIILDINLPDGSGFSLLKQVKQEHPDIAVIMLTANDTDSDVVRGLEGGADDYVTKPFSLSVLRARVNNQLRKRDIIQSNKMVCFDHFAFDFQNMVFTVDGVQIELSKTEQKLLRLLTENPGITLRRDTLINRVWTDGSDYVDENALSVAVKRLRDKLGAQDYIKTVYGIGYAWVNNHV